MSGQFQTEPITNSCAFKQRKAGISIPQCPPAVEIEINCPLINIENSLFA